MSTAFITAQTKENKEKKSEESIYVRFKEEFKDKKPTVFVDGKKFEFSIDLLDPNQIESVSVFKSDMAMERFNAPNGVVYIVTKKGSALDKNKLISDLEVTEVFKDSKKPLVIIDGKVSDQVALDKLDKKNIDKIDVLKGKAAEAKYKAPNGVIIITTKKKDKN